MPRTYYGYTKNRAKANLDALWAAIAESSCNSTAPIALPDETAVMEPTYFGHSKFTRVCDLDALWAMLPGAQPAWPADDPTRVYRGRASTKAYANLDALYAALRALGDCCDDDVVIVPPSCHSALVSPLTDLWSENFCPYASHAEWEAAAAALNAANDVNGYALQFKFWDWAIEDDLDPSRYVFGDFNTDAWNGGHNYLEQIHPIASQYRGVRFDAALGYGPGVNNKIWRDLYDGLPAASMPGPYGTWQRLVCKFSSGYKLADYDSGSAYHQIFRTHALPGYDEVTFGHPQNYVMGLLDLTIYNSSVVPDGLPHLLLNGDATLEFPGGVNFVDLGDATDLVFDGQVHTWELETTRYEPASDPTYHGSRRTVVVRRDGVELFNDVVNFVGAFVRQRYYPEKFFFFDCENPPAGYGGDELLAEQSWRLYEMEGKMIGTP